MFSRDRNRRRVLRGQVAVITGVGSGIGRALALVLLLAAGLCSVPIVGPAAALAQSVAAANDDDSSTPAALDPQPDLGMDDPSAAWVLISHADPIVKLVILVMLVFSLVSWAIILQRWIIIRRAWTQSEAFLAFFWKTDSLDDAHDGVDRFPESPVAQAFTAGRS